MLLGILFVLNMPVYAQSTEGKIVFHSDRDGDLEIYVMDATGENVQQLTFNSCDDGWPSWSFDGKMIFFESDCDGNWEVFRVNSDGSNLTQLTHTATAGNGEATLSPNGNVIVFQSDLEGTYDLYLMGAEGDDMMLFVYSETKYLGWPDWSHDGRYIVYDAGDSINVIDTDIWEDSSIRVNATIGLPRWSSDDSQIAYISHENGSADIYTMNRDGTQVQRLTFGDSLDRRPDWSGDDTSLVFESDRDGDGEIYIMDIATRETIQISDNRFDDGAPEWWTPEGGESTDTVTSNTSQAGSCATTNASINLKFARQLIQQQRYAKAAEVLVDILGEDSACHEVYLYFGILEVEARGAEGCESAMTSWGLYTLFASPLIQMDDLPEAQPIVAEAYEFCESQ